MARLPSAAGAAVRAPGSLVLRVLGIIGCLAVAAIHVIDQGGLPGTKDPQYVQMMYYALEAAGVVAAALLLARQARSGWVLALGVAVRAHRGLRPFPGTRVAELHRRRRQLD